ncbi:MAG: hypothetical protein CM15mV4_0510 [Caudoviricetes sp.]|nr:MAG: hypothetical protein CM15mV4_0510 [Caudoviricetes sp.]
MKSFEDCLEGHFDNKYQAMKDPSRYAHIKISHVRLGEDIFTVNRHIVTKFDNHIDNLC